MSTSRLLGRHADYLVKGRLEGELLDRSIRYAVERSRAEERALAVARAEVAQADAERAREQLPGARGDHCPRSRPQPLAAIRGHAQLLLRQRELGAIGACWAGSRADRSDRREHGRRLSELVAASAGHADVSLERAPTDLHALVRHAVAGVELTTRRRHHFLCSLPGEPVMGQWDSSRLTRVLSNLLSNAVKYSPDGGTVVVELRSETAADGSCWAVVSVRAPGIGIPEADVQHIFEPFHRGANAAENAGGAGIGLASARQIVHAHGGTIEVQTTTLAERQHVHAAITAQVAAPSRS